MANELSIQAVLSYAKGTIASHAWNTGTITRNVSGTNYVRNVQAVGTAEEALILGDVGTLGYILMKNLDATNYVEYQSGTGVAAAIKLKAGDVALFRAGSAAPFVKANTSTVNIEYIIIPD